MPYEQFESIYEQQVKGLIGLGGYTNFGRLVHLITGVSKTIESVNSSSSRLKCTEHDVHRVAGQSNTMKLMTYVHGVPCSRVSDTSVK
jgi:hypothetical protein